jgi:hypothetical protein
MPNNTLLPIEIIVYLEKKNKDPKEKTMEKKPLLSFPP